MARTDTDGSDTDTKLNTVMPETPTTAATNSVKHVQASDKKRGEAATTANNNSEAIARTQTTIRKVTFALPPEAEPMSVLAKVTKRRNSLRQCRPQTQKFQDFQESRKKQKRETPKSTVGKSDAGKLDAGKSDAAKSDAAKATATMPTAGAGDEMGQWMRPCRRIC